MSMRVMLILMHVGQYTHILIIFYVFGNIGYDEGWAIFPRIVGSYWRRRRRRRRRRRSGLEFWYGVVIADA
jgi:hypothetical protein